MSNRKCVYYWLRVLRDMTQEEVADKLLISLSYMRILESGCRKPSKRLVRAYAKLFVVDHELLENFDAENIGKSTKDYLNSLIHAIDEREHYLRVMMPARTVGKYTTDNKQPIRVRYSTGSIDELYDAVPSCRHEIVPRMSGGVYCSKCGGWFSY